MTSLPCPAPLPFGPPRGALAVLGVVLTTLGCSPSKSPGDNAVDWGDSGASDDDQQYGPYDDPNELQIGTFNIEWLTVDPLFETRRNDVDHEMIRRLIVEHGLDVMVLQEVEGEGGMAHLDLPSRWSWTYGSTGWSQNLVVLWRNDLVELVDVRELNLRSTTGASKQPIVARMRHLQGELDFTLVGVHSKPFTDDDDARYRFTQVAELADWIEGELPDTFDGEFAKNVAIAGDFNDTFEGLNQGWKSLDLIEQQLGYTFATRTSTSYSQVSYESLIDHIALSPGLVNRWTEADQEDGAHIIAHDLESPWSDYEGGYRDQQNISDHRPVWLYLSTSP